LKYTHEFYSLFVASAGDKGKAIAVDDVVDEGEDNYVDLMLISF